MATFTVDTTADTVDAKDGVLSLREALALADVDPATGDKIDFDSSVQGQSIVLAGSQLTVNSDVTIDGGAGVAIEQLLLLRTIAGPQNATIVQKEVERRGLETWR